MAYSARERYRKRNDIRSEQPITGDMGLSLERDIERDKRLKAIELARQANAARFNAGIEQINAGNDRTTQPAMRQQASTNNLPVYKGMNIASNGADVDQDKFKTEVTTQNGWKGLNGTGIAKQIKGNGVTEAESLAHAKDVMSNYKFSDKAMSILDEYVAKDDESKRGGLWRFESQGSYSGALMNLGNKFKAETGVSDEEFTRIFENYSRLKHAKERELQQQEYAEMGNGERVAKSLVNAPKNVLGGYQSLIGSLQNPSDPELGRDYNSEFFRYSNENTDIRNAQNEAINKIENPVVKTLAHFGYNAGVMGVESATAALTGEAGLGSFFASGYSAGIKDAEDRGLSPEQSQAYALAVGSLEYFTERIPWEGLRNIYAGNAVSKDAVKGSIMPYIKALLKQSGSEAAEEVINGIGETIADGFIAGDKSNLNNAIQSYVTNEGLTEEEATRKAIWDVVKQTADAAITAAISAGVSAGPALASEAYTKTKVGKDIVKNAAGMSDEESPYYIPDTRDSYVADEDYEQALNTREAINDASRGRVSGKQARAIYESVAETEDNLNVARRVEAIKDFEGNKAKAEEKPVEQETEEYKTPLKPYQKQLEDIEFASYPYQLAKAIDEVTEKTDEIKELIAFKRDELKMYGFSEKDIDNAITPKKAYEMGQQGETISEEQLNTIPEADRKEVLASNNQQFNKAVLKENPNAVLDKSTGKYFAPSKVEIKGDEYVIVDSEGNTHSDFESPKLNAALDAYTQVSKNAYTGKNSGENLYNVTVNQAGLAADVAIKSENASAIQVRTVIEAVFNDASIASKTWNTFESKHKYFFDVVDKAATKALYEQVRDDARKSDRVKLENTKGQRTSDQAVSKTLKENLDEATVAQLEAFAKKIGYNFVASTSKDARGEILPSKRQISIGSNSLNEIYAIQFHEGIAEYLQAHGNEEEVLEIQDLMLNYLEDKMGSESFNDLVNTYQSVYRTGATSTVDKGKSRRAAANEMFADTVWTLFSSEEGFNEFTSWISENNSVEEQKSIFDKIKDFITSILDAISEYINTGSFNAAERAALEMDAAKAKEIRDRIFKAMDAAIENAKASDNSKMSKADDNDIQNIVRHSFAGINSETADKEQLKKAQELQKKGMGDLTILETTGWFLGMDNQWKYEIPDNDIEIFKEGNRDYIKNNPDFARYLELENKILFTDSDYTEEEYNELMRLDEVVTSDEYYKTKRYGKLSDFIQHDELFRSYPWMENVDVMFVPMESDKEKGYADPEDLVIALNLKFQTDVAWNKDALKSTLLHEIQHIIQAQEGFAGGSTPEWWSYIRDERIERDKKNIEGAKEYLQNFVDKAKKEGKPASTGEFVEQSVKRVADKDDSYNMEDHWATVADWKATSSIYHYEHMISKLERHIDRLLSESDIELYYNTAGEIEARDTANRANLTKEQRIETFPNQNARDVVYPKSNIMDRRYSKKVDTKNRSLSEGQQEYFKDSKVVDDEGRLKVVYHGTQEEFYTFNPVEKGGKNGRAEGYGIYFAENQEITNAYGDRQLEGYLNMTKPAYDNKKTIKAKDLAKLIEATCRKEANQLLADGGYDSLDEAIKDTWVSNVVYTYDKPMKQAYLEAAQIEIDHSQSDMSIIQGLMNDTGVYSYSDAYEFYKQLTTVLGFDGYITDWESPNGDVNRIYVAFYSNQFKNIDNLNPTDNSDIRKSIKVDWDNKTTYKLPDRTYEDDIFFLGTDEEIEAAEKQEITAKAYVANIIHSKDFAGLMFKDSIGLDRLLTRSTRKDFDWQLSESRDGKPIGHENYKEENDDITSYDTWPSKTMAALYNEIINELPKTDAIIHVIREGIAEDARKSIKVYGDASPYADSINETKTIQTLISSMNSALIKADVFTMPNDEILRIERDIVNKYKVEGLEEGEIGANVSYAFAYLQNDKLESDYDNVMNFLLNIGDEVIKHSNLKDEISEKVYNDTRDILKSYKIKLSDAERAEISRAYGDSWKSAFGALQKAGIKLDNKNGIGIDTVFSEIKDEILKTAGIDIEYGDKPSEQILTLIDTMNYLEPKPYLWEGANDLDKALTVVSDIVDMYYTAATEQLEKSVVKNTDKGKEAIKKSIEKEKSRLRGEWAKYKANKEEEFNSIVAEKNRLIQAQQNEIKKQKEQLKGWEQDSKAKEKELSKRSLTDKEAAATARLQARQAVESYKAREERARQIDSIKKTGIRLIKWLDNPTDNQHVPAFLQKPLGEFLAAIDFLPKNAKANSKSTLTWQQRMQSLRETLVKIKDAEVEDDGSAEAYFAQNMIAKELISMMDDFLGKEEWDEFTQSYIIIKRAAAKVSLLDPKELQTLNKIMSALSASINNMNKTYANSVFKHVSELAKESVKEVDALPKRKDMQKLMSKAFNFFNFDELEPITYFEGLGKGAKSIFQELRDGFDLKTKHVKEADKYMDEAKKELGIDNKELSTWKNQVHSFKLTEGNIMLNTTQIMSLYRIIKRKQGKPHVAVGGIKAADFEYKDGKLMKQHHQAKAIHIRATEAKAIIDTLTPEQKALADKMQKFMASDCAAWGNRVTEKMFGYKKYEEEDYFPLKTDAHSRATTASSDNNVSYYTIKNSSFTKPITPMANNAVVLEDIFDVFTNHVVQMADYDAYVMPIADAMRWFNYSERVVNAIAPDELNEAGARVDYIGNMQESIDRVYGEAGLNYFKRFIKDINGDHAGTGGMNELLSSLMSMYKAQAVGANMRVVIQQPTAVVRASDVIEPKYLLKALASITKAPEYAKKAQENSPIAYWKAQGYYETYLGQSFKEIITGDTTLRDRINDAAGALAGKADDLSWGIMYKAAELKVLETTDLKEGTAKFDEAATRIFEDIVDHTQVVDTIFHKSQYMRNQGLGYKATSAFMSEPTKTYNMLYRAYRDAKLSGDKSFYVKRLRDVGLIFLFEQLLNAFITGVWDMLRDDEKEDYISSFKQNFSENAIDNLNPLNLMPIAKEITSAIQGYDATSYATDAIYTTVESFKALAKIVNGKSTKTPYGNVYQIAKSASQLTGVPVANILREFKTLYNTVNDFWGGKDLISSQTKAKQVEKKRETNRVSEVFDTKDLGAIKAEIKTSYDNAIADGKDESQAWKSAREMLKNQYQRLVEENPDNKASITNRFKTLLKYTKKADGKGGYRIPSDKEVANWIEGWEK